MTAVIKSTLLALVVVAGTASAAPGQTTTPARIAFVNARLALESMPGYAQAESTWAREAEQAEGELQRLQTQFDSLVTEFQQQEAMLTATVRQQRRQALESRGQEMQRQAGEIQNRIARREVELLQPMQQRLLAVLEGMRAEQNLTMVIDIGAREHGIVTWDRSLDITQRVIDRLRQSD
jgi:outer membrane protein